MGKLAMWGAIGGAAAGMQKNIDVQRKREDEAKAEEREMALRKYEAEEAAKRQQAGFGHEEKMQSGEFGEREKLQGSEIKARSELQGQEIKAKEKEGAANRASAERIAGTRAKAIMASHPGQPRWKFVTSKTDPIIDMKNGQVLPGKLQNILRDTDKGLSFIQSGDRFLLPDVDPAATKPAAASEIRKLLQNPDQADNFLATYKYLPMQFIATQTSAANWRNSPGTQAAPQADDDNEPAVTDEQ